MIEIPISVGELIDKLSILQVKKNKIQNKTKLELVDKEYKLLYNLSKEYLTSNEINDLYNGLIDQNSKLWEIEDKLRVLETESRFEGEFIDLARKVYFTNDDRFDLKNKINSILSSEIKEVKEYVDYKNK